MADKKGEEPGKGKAEKEETQPSHSKDTQMEVKDPVEGLQVDDPADLTDPSSEDEDLYRDWDHFERHGWRRWRSHRAEPTPEELMFRTSAHKPKRWRFREEERYREGRLHTFMESVRELTDRTETDDFKLATIRCQDIPGDIKRQRSLQQDFYTAWKKQKFGPSEESEDGETPFSKLLLRTPTEMALEQCMSFPSTIDNLTSSFSQLSNAFLLFANAYPKHATTCYKMAESSFKMAILASQVLSALWKLNHGFTLSSMETAIKELQSPILFLLIRFHNVSMSFQYLYSVFVKHVTSKKAFERDEEFQIGYKQPPIEAQILAFTSAVDVNSGRLGEVIVQIKKLVERPTDLPKLEEDPEQRMEKGESNGPNTLNDVVAHITDFMKEMSTICGTLNNYNIQDS